MDLSGNSFHLGRVGGGEIVIRIVIILYIVQNYLFSTKKSTKCHDKDHNDLWLTSGVLEKEKKLSLATLVWFVPL